MFRSVDDPKEVTVWADFETVETAKAFAPSDGLLDAMKTAGVQDTAIWVGNEA